MSSKAGVAEGKPATTPNPADDLRSLALPELQAKLGSSPDGLSGARTVRLVQTDRSPGRSAAAAPLAAASMGSD